MKKLTKNKNNFSKTTITQDIFKLLSCHKPPPPLLIFFSHTSILENCATIWPFYCIHATRILLTNIAGNCMNDFSIFFFGQYKYLRFSITNEKLVISFGFLITFIQINIITIGEIWHTSYAYFLENSNNSSESDASMFSLFF